MTQPFVVEESKVKGDEIDIEAKVKHEDRTRSRRSRSRASFNLANFVCPSTSRSATLEAELTTGQEPSPAF